MEYRDLMGLVASLLAVCVGSTGLMVVSQKPIAATALLVASLFLGLAILVMAIASMV